MGAQVPTRRSDDQTMKLVEQLRSMGARRVVVGDVEAEFAPASPASPTLPPRPPETDAQRRARVAREQEEADAVLFHSS